MQNHCRVPPNTIADELVVARGPLRVEIGLRPFSFTVRRDRRRLLRAAGLWVADGTVHDQFIQFTEGVVAREQRAPVERALNARVIWREQSSVKLSVGLYGGRAARLGVELHDRDQIQLELEADGEPLRLAFDWDRRSGERLVGLGLRHNTSLDQAGRKEGSIVVTHPPAHVASGLGDVRAVRATTCGYALGIPTTWPHGGATGGRNGDRLARRSLDGDGRWR